MRKLKRFPLTTICAAASLIALAAFAQPTNGSYAISGDFVVKPVNVFYDNGKTYIQMQPAQLLPALIVNGQMTPYTVQAPYMVISGAPERIDLVSDGVFAMAVKRAPVMPAAPAAPTYQPPAPPPQQTQYVQQVQQPAPVLAAPALRSGWDGPAPTPAAPPFVPPILQAQAQAPLQPYAKTVPAPPDLIIGKNIGHMGNIKHGWQLDYILEKQIEGLKASLQSDNKSGAFTNNFNWQKAVYMGNLTSHVYAEANTKGVTEWLYSYTAALQNAAKTNQAPMLVSPTILGGQRRLNPDAWMRINVQAARKNSMCAVKELASAQVSLIGVEYEASEGYESYKRHGELMLEAAVNTTKLAEQKINDCDANEPKPQPVQALPMVTAPPPPPPATPKAFVLQTQKVDIKADALFAFDGYKTEAVSADGLQKLDDLILQLRTRFVSLDQIEVSGHADRIGSEAYNKTLSANRAATVRDYIAKGFINNGVLNVEKITSMHFATAKPLVVCKGDYIVGGKVNQQLVSCLAPNRRVEITVRGMVKADPSNTPSSQ